MPKKVERIYLHGAWLGVGGNTPWGLSDKITEITVHEVDPRDFEGADSAFIVIKFDDGNVLEVKTSDYTVYRKGSD